MTTRALLLALPLVALGACRDNRASVQIQDICSATTDCVFGDTCDTVALGNPVIDRAVTSVLTLPLQVENQLLDNAGLELGKANTNDAHIDEVAVEYTGAFSGRVVFEANGRIPAATSTIFFADIIPSQTGLLIPTPALGTGREVVAALKLRGYYDDGSRFETGEFPVAITVCNGCSEVCATGLYCPHPGQYPVECMDPAGAGTTP